MGEVPKLKGFITLMNPFLFLTYVSAQKLSGFIDRNEEKHLVKDLDNIDWITSTVICQ